MGAQSWGQRPLTPGPLLARFVPNCANWSVGTAHWATPICAGPNRLVQTLAYGTNSCVLYSPKLGRVRRTDPPLWAQPTAQWVLRTRPLAPFHLGLPSSPRPHFAHPTWRSQLPSAQLPQIVWDKPLRAMLCSLCSSPPILQTPKTISLFLTCALCTVAPTREVATV